jgi:hypothetical protein
LYKHSSISSDSIIFRPNNYEILMSFRNAVIVVFIKKICCSKISLCRGFILFMWVNQITIFKKMGRLSASRLCNVRTRSIFNIICRIIMVGLQKIDFERTTNQKKFTKKMEMFKNLLKLNFKFKKSENIWSKQ